jgi:hypothetical protein
MIRYALRAGVLLALSASGLAAQRRPCTIPDFPAPTLCERAGLDTVRASYLLLLDESGSMVPLWEAVRRALSGFAQAIPEGDQFEVRTFAGGVRTLIPPIASTPETRRAWASTLSALPTPTGAKTDLGRAAESIVETLRALPPSRLTFVFVLTDGRQDPEPASPFSASGGGRWPEIAAQLATLEAVRPTQFVVLRLTADADAQGLLRRTLPKPVVVDVTAPGALSAWFAEQTRKVAVEKLLLLVRSELRRPAARFTAQEPLATGRLGSAPSTVILAPTRRVLETRFSDGLSGGGVNVSATMSNPGPLPGGDRRTASVSLADMRPWYLPPTSDTDSAHLTLRGTATLEPAAELRLLGVPMEPRSDSVVVDVEVEQPATGYWSTIAGLVAAIMALVAWLSHRAYVPRASGMITVSSGDAERSERLALTGVASQVVADAAGRPLATVRTDRRWWRNTRTVVAAGPRPLRMNGKPLRGPVKLPRSSRLDGDDCTIKILLD